jgi:ribose 5-phosphate isomerase A
LLICQSLGIYTTTLNHQKPDWGFDGADEVDSNLRLIKGRGGALFKEKLIMKSSRKTFILVDDSKFVSSLGKKIAVPIEVFPDALSLVEQELLSFSLDDLSLRLAKGKDGPVITENGNFILDVFFKDIQDSLEKEVKSIPGVIESGLFIGYPIEILKNN